MNWKKLIIVLWVIATGSIYAQDAVIKGAIIDSNNVAVPFITVVVFENQSLLTQTDSLGDYRLKVPANQPLTIIYSYFGKELKRQTVNLKKNEIRQIDFQVKNQSFELGTVIIKDQSSRELGLSDLKVREIISPDASGGDIVNLIQAQALGFNRNNELSSNYSVRGGNFDENLIYVNDFEVYRPYLMRSGQQEGLSFANPNLVGNIKFSSGGFQARYGDKMASVMDVTYRKPKKFAGSVSGSLLGFAAHLEGCSKSIKKNEKKGFTFLIGFRQKLNKYILGSLDTKGQYNPSFYDVQLYTTYQFNEKWMLEYLGNFAMNKFDFSPETQTTKFGSIQDVKQLEMAFEGGEADRYFSVMNGLSLSYKPTEKIQLKLLSSAYNSREKEAFDIYADYRIGDVETDQSKDSYGEVKAYRGIGALHNWARNYLNTDIYYAGHRGSWIHSLHQLSWGIDYKHEIIQDKLSEWDRIDSSGYSLPYTTAGQAFYGDSMPDNFYQLIGMNRVLKSKFNLSSNRFSAFIQENFRFGDRTRFTLNIGLRLQYWDVNKEFIATPRATLSIKPNLKKDVLFTISGGLYYQPPFYREMRNLNGVVNTNLKAQKSAHVVAGVNYAFKAWKRPFNFVTEFYYKYLWDLVSYQYLNALIRYDGKNNARGYASGIDMRLNGELAAGAESWISLSFMHTSNTIDGSTKRQFLDSAGNVISVVNESNINTIKDTVYVPVGAQPRPSDQLVTCNIFFSDYLPKFPFIKFNMNLVFGSGIPYKSPSAAYYDTKYRLPFYRRLDMGFAGKVWDPKWAKKKTKLSEGIKSAWVSFDVLNILGIGNTISYQYIKDYYNNEYAVPNYLSGRRFNFKVIINFSE